MACSHPLQKREPRAYSYEAGLGFFKCLDCDQVHECNHPRPLLDTFRGENCKWLQCDSCGRRWKLTDPQFVYFRDLLG